MRGVLRQAPAGGFSEAGLRRLADEARAVTDATTRKSKAREAQWYTNRSKVYQEEQNRSVVQHEAAHQLLYNFRVHNLESSWANPQWLVEGLATLFEVPPGKHGAGAGVINQRRLGDIREPIAGFTAEDWRRFIGAASPGIVCSPSLKKPSPVPT